MKFTGVLRKFFGVSNWSRLFRGFRGSHSDSVEFKRSLMRFSEGFEGHLRLFKSLQRVSVDSGSAGASVEFKGSLQRSHEDFPKSFNAFSKISEVLDYS